MALYYFEQLIPHSVVCRALLQACTWLGVKTLPWCAEAGYQDHHPCFIPSSCAELQLGNFEDLTLYVRNSQRDCRNLFVTYLEGPEDTKAELHLFHTASLRKICAMAKEAHRPMTLKDLERCLMNATCKRIERLEHEFQSDRARHAQHRVNLEKEAASILQEIQHTSPPPRLPLPHDLDLLIPMLAAWRINQNRVRLQRRQESL